MLATQTNDRVAREYLLIQRRALLQEDSLMKGFPYKPGDMLSEYNELKRQHRQEMIALIERLCGIR
jgi:hypothetical protein